MSVARATRLLLAVISLVIVAWSFYDVGARTWRRHKLEQARPITLTILHWGAKDEDTIVQTLADRYMASHPKVRIVRIGTPDSPALTAKFKTMIAANEPPDLLYLPPDLLPDAADLKLVHPVDGYVQKELAKPGGQAWYDDYFPLLMKAWRYDAKTGLRGSGPLYGLPKDFTTALCYINVDLFEKAGIDWRAIQKDGWTWDEWEADIKRISSLSNTPGYEGRQVYGAALEFWPDTIRNVIWTFGGDFFGPGGFRDIALDSPAAQEALSFLYRVVQVEKTCYYPSGIAKEAGQEFFTGNIGCYGPVGRWKVPRFKDITSFKWDCVPIPFKRKEFQTSQIYYTAWSMSEGGKHHDEAFELMKFLCGGEGAILQSRMALAIPPLKSVAYSKDFLAPEGIPPHDAQVFLDAVNYMRLQQTPREPEWSDIIKNEFNRCVQLGEITPADVARNVRQKWLTELDSPLRRQTFPPMRWDFVVFCTIAVLAAVVAALWWRARRERLGPLDRGTERTGYAFILPWLIGFALLTIGPMVMSLLLSFTQWGALTPMSAARSVGTANYAQLVKADPKFFLSLRVTLYYVILAVPISQALALGVAVLMNVRVRGIAAYRTIFFVPSLIVASVVGAVLWMQMYNNQYGIINQMLRPVLGLFHAHPPDWFGTDAKYWAIPGFVLMSVWGVGGAMILYLAGLKGIPVSLYEAATIDGAGRAKQFVHVTLPMLSPLIFYNVVMGLIGSFQLFVQPMVMTDGGPNDLTLTYVLNLYRQAFQLHKMGYASAMAWILFVLLLGLTALVFRGSKNIVYYEGLKT